MKLSMLVTVLVMAAIMCRAQRMATVSACYTYHAPETMTIEQAKQVALQRAMIEALAEEFGTLVQQVNTTTVSNSGGDSSVNFSSLGTSDVRGEWVETIGEPVYEIDFQDGFLSVTVSVKGKAREVAYLKSQFATQLLRNGTRENFESEEFRDGDYLYASVTSSVEGYIAIFCKDDSIRCLLPDAPDGIQRIEVGRRHLFFTERGKRLQMVYDSASETNAIYFLFSPNPIIRPLTRKIDDGGLPVFSDDEFNRWLADMRNHDRQLQIEIKYIYIKRTS